MSIEAAGVPCAYAEPSALSRSNVNSVPLEELEYGISDRIARVDEFRFIREEAARLGVRAWLFGGTAAGYGHYVKWDLLREKGDPRFQPDRFDYDYTNIYRSTQDLDIVVDGNPEQAAALQSALQEKYPHLQGAKTAWEVRLLKSKLNDKEPLLDNPGYLNQHTDSNSTGMIELTKPPRGEPVVRDLRDWKAKEPYFLKDLGESKLHYYFSPTHMTTPRAAEGLNPPLLSVIRYLTKAFQYELELRPEDLKTIRKIIGDFDPSRDVKNPYVKKWIEKNGKKLIQNAVNIEYAWNTLENLGLRKKLAEINKNPEDMDSLAWWMAKEPLRSAPVGTGVGPTARELKLDVLAHETKSFLAYESITRAPTGAPNVLISRGTGVGELAAFGDGFYTRVGTEGARNTGLTVRFHLDPDAREGTDFTREKTDFVRVLNKNALSVIPESLNIGPLEFFRMLKDNPEFDSGELGILEKLRRRIGAKINAITPAEEAELVKIVRKNPTPMILSEWFFLPVSRKHPEIVDELLRKRKFDSDILEDVLSNPEWPPRPDWLEQIMSRGVIDNDIHHVLALPHWNDHPELVRALMRNTASRRAVAEIILPQPHWRNHPELVQALLDAKDVDKELIRHTLSQPHWADHQEWIPRLLAHPENDRFLATYLLGGQWAAHPEWQDWVETLIERGNADREIAEFIVSHPLEPVLRNPNNAARWVDRLLERGSLGDEVTLKVVSAEHWPPEVRTRWVREILENPQKGAGGLSGTTRARLVMQDPESHAEWVESLLKLNDWDVDSVIAQSLIKPQWADHPELALSLIKRLSKMPVTGAYSVAVHLSNTLKSGHGSAHPKVLQALYDQLQADPRGRDLPLLRKLADELRPLLKPKKSAACSDQFGALASPVRGAGQ